jgi:thiamine-phosphate pyrophosphorylase
VPADVVDYVCIGGVFETPSKDNPDPPIGLDGLARLVARMNAAAPGLPVGAIAGIGAGNAADVIAAGADGIAVVSALFLANDVAAAARELAAIVAAARRARRLQPEQVRP